jgi:hypothetical protein
MGFDANGMYKNSAGASAAVADLETVTEGLLDGKLVLVMLEGMVGGSPALLPTLKRLKRC